MLRNQIEEEKKEGMHKYISAEEMEEIIQQVINKRDIDDDPEAAEAFFEEQWEKIEAYTKKHKFKKSFDPLLEIPPGKMVDDPNYVHDHSIDG